MNTPGNYHTHEDAPLMKSVFHLTNRGLYELLEYVRDGDSKHLEWLKRHNPPGAAWAPRLHGLTMNQIGDVAKALWRLA